jgi:hypothetical protein
MAPKFQSVHQPPQTQVRARNGTTLLDLGALYRAVDWRRPHGAATGPHDAQLELLASARLTDLRLEPDGRRGLPQVDRRETWVDPVLGLGGRVGMTEPWEAFAEADIGGCGVGADLTWPWFAGIGYDLGHLGRASWLRGG